MSSQNTLNVSNAPLVQEKYEADLFAHIYLQGWDTYGRGPRKRVWEEFYRQWWGSTSQEKDMLEAPLAAIRIIGDESFIWPELNLVPSNGWLIVRDEYVKTYERLRRLYESPRNPGVVLTGNPGIGKTYFGVYTLLRRMTERKTTLFTTKNGDTFLFHESGIRHKRKTDVMFDDLPFSENPTFPRAWSVVDSAEDEKPEDSRLVGCTVFVLFTCTPKERRYAGWLKYSGGLLWVMNPWTSEELGVLLSNASYTQLSGYHIYPNNSSENIQKFMEDIGPCPRDIIRALMHPRAHRAQMNSVLVCVTHKNILRLFSESFNSSEATSHGATLLRREDEDEDNSKLSDDDLYRVEFKTKAVAERANVLFRDLSLEEHQTFLASAGMSPTARWATGHSFGVVVREYLRGVNGWRKAFRELVSMEFSPTHAHPHRYKGTCPNDHNRSPSKSTIELPICDRNSNVFGCAGSRLDASTLYNPSNATCDSFFLDFPGGNPVLWVFQVTIANNHDAKVSGLLTVKELQDQFKPTYSNVTTNLVLVTPYGKGRAVNWYFEKDPKEIHIHSVC